MVDPAAAMRVAQEIADAEYVPPPAVAEGWMDIQKEIEAGKITGTEALDRLDGLMRAEVQRQHRGEG